MSAIGDLYKITYVDKAIDVDFKCDISSESAVSREPLEVCHLQHSEKETEDDFTEVSSYYYSVTLVRVFKKETEILFVN